MLEGAFVLGGIARETFYESGGALADFARESALNWEFIKPDVKALPRDIYSFYGKNIALAANVFQDALLGELGDDARMFFVGVGKFMAGGFFKKKINKKGLLGPPISGGVKKESKT